MKQKFLRICALGLVAALLFGFAACNGGKDDPTTTAANDTTAASNTTAAPDGTTAAQDGSTTTTTTAPDGTTAAPDGSTTTAPDNTTATGGSQTGQTEATTKAPKNKPETPAEILAAYTEVMTKAKTDIKHYRKLEYQELPKDKIVFDNGLVGRLVSLANSFMTSKDKALKSNDYLTGTDDLYWLPVCRTKLGCLIKDPSVFQSTNSEKLSNGNIKLTLVLKDEKNAEPAKENATTAPSNVGGMFNPLAKADIDDTLKNDSTVKFLVKDANYELTYRRCTAVVVYNPQNNQIVSMEQRMNIFINILSGKFIGFSVKGTGELDTYLGIDQAQY